MRRTVAFLGVLAVLLFLVGFNGLATAQSGNSSESPVRIARASWDTGWFQTEVYRLLIQYLGYQVDDAITMGIQDFYEAVADGEMDLWANGWFPTHNSHMDAERSEAVGFQVHQGALQGYFIDKATAEEYDITNLGDLSNPTIAALFDTDDDGRANLLGCQEDWGCAEIIDDHLEEYGLTDTVEHIQGQYSPQIRDLIDNQYRAGDPVLYYTWTPNWTSTVLVPGQNAVWVQSDINDIRAVANTDFLDRNPDIRRLLEVVAIPLADIAARHSLWLHVDAAYAGAAGILPEKRHFLDGCERADTFLFNPHKWLFTPMDLTAFYCRRPEELRQALSLVPDYLRSQEDQRAVNFMEYALPLGRRFRALKLWFVMRYFGREGLAANLREHIRLADVFARRVDEHPDFERLAPAPFSAVCFRCRPPSVDPEDLNAVNQRLLEAVNDSGEFFLSSTVLHEQVALRVAIGNIHTREQHVNRLWELLLQKSTEAAAAGRKKN